MVLLTFATRMPSTKRLLVKKAKSDVVNNLVTGQMPPKQSHLNIFYFSKNYIVTKSRITKMNKSRNTKCPIFSYKVNPIQWLRSKKVKNGERSSASMARVLLPF